MEGEVIKDKNSEIRKSFARKGRKTGKRGEEGKRMKSGKRGTKRQMLSAVGRKEKRYEE